MFACMFPRYSVHYNSFFKAWLPLTGLSFAWGEIFSRTFSIFSRVSKAIRSTSADVKFVVGMGSRTTCQFWVLPGLKTLDLYFSWFEASFLDTEETFIVCYHDRDDGYPRLNREMEGSLFEGQHYWTISVGSRSFRKYPYTLLETSQTLFAEEWLRPFVSFVLLRCRKFWVQIGGLRGRWRRFRWVPLTCQSTFNK